MSSDHPSFGDQRRDKEETVLNVQYFFRSPLIGDKKGDEVNCTQYCQIVLHWESKKRVKNNIFLSQFISKKSDHPSVGINKEM